MTARTRTLFPAARLALAACMLGSLLTACGGGSDDSTTTAAGGSSGTAGGGGTAAASSTPGCDTSKFSAGSVAAPTAAQLGAYAGTYVGDEGKYGPNPGDPFVKSGSATAVLSAAGALTYKGVAYTVNSICLDKAPGPAGTLLYVHTDKGHLDITDKVDPVLGSAWGISPADSTLVWTNGKKQ